MEIVVFVNPGSRANRKDPGTAARFAAILGDFGQVVCTRSLDHLAREAQRIAVLRPKIIGIHGGDGTLHKTLSALLLAYGETPLPPVAILQGGTMNVVAASLGLKAVPEQFLESLLRTARAAKPLAILERRCLRVEDHFGFIFGNGLLANFLEEYYAKGRYGALRVLGIIARLALSVLTTRQLARRLFRPFSGLVTIDGMPLSQDHLVGFGVATVTEIGFGMKLHHRADDDPTRMGGLAILGSPLSLLWDVLDVRLGRGISPKRAHSFVASRVDIQPREHGGWFTLDGDLYPLQGPIAVTLGPTLRLIKPKD